MNLDYMLSDGGNNEAVLSPDSELSLVPEILDQAEPEQKVLNSDNNILRNSDPVEANENNQNTSENDDLVNATLVTGFRNLQMLNSVQIGLTSFLLGIVIIFCFIGKLR